MNILSDATMGNIAKVKADLDSEPELVSSSKILLYYIYLPF